MRTSIKDVGFAVFFLMVIALVAVEAAEDGPSEPSRTVAEEHAGK